MPTTNPNDVLVKAIEQVRLLSNTREFFSYWELYREVADIEQVEDIFFHFDVENGFYNVAMLGDGRIVDIVGDHSDGSGGLGVYAPNSIHGVIVRREPLTALRHTKDASLLVVARQAGRDYDESLYWFAKTREQEQQLVKFAQSIVTAVSRKFR